MTVIIKKFLGKHYSNTDKIIADGVTCDIKAMSCKDSKYGTIAWIYREPTCANMHSEIFNGLAQIFFSNENSSSIALISDIKQESYAGNWILVTMTNGEIQL